MSRKWLKIPKSPTSFFWVTFFSSRMNTGNSFFFFNHKKTAEVTLSPSNIDLLYSCSNVGLTVVGMRRATTVCDSWTAVCWDRASYHHHVSSERIGQVSYSGLTVSIRGLALRAVSWFVSPGRKSTVWPRGKTTTRRTQPEKLTLIQKMSKYTGSRTSSYRPV